MRIFNTQVYGLEESIIRSGYPKSTKVKGMQTQYNENVPSYYKGFERAINLGNAKSGSGHDCFLKGIVVQADFEAPQYWWQQFQRYHFADIISSQSKMHKILEMDLSIQCNKHVWRSTIDNLKKNIEFYKEIDNEEVKKIVFHEIISNLPMGLNLTAGITTNYLQLKTIYNQRKGHKMDDWSIDFIKWCDDLPMFKELCLGGK